MFGEKTTSAAESCAHTLKPPNRNCSVEMRNEKWGVKEGSEERSFLHLYAEKRVAGVWKRFINFMFFRGLGPFEPNS